MTAARSIELATLMEVQSGVVSRQQLVASGIGTADIARMIRRRELARTLPGVYVDHTGNPTWRQRAWAACLYHWPAALFGPSAVRAAVGPRWRHHDDADAILVAVDTARRVKQLPGHRVRRVTGLDDLVAWNASPPRIRLEEAAVDAALLRSDPLARIGLLADLCQTGRTSASRLLSAVEARPRVRDRAWLVGVLSDLASGTCSTLEHGYLTFVERPHGLPRATRQRPDVTDRGRVRRDVDYAPLPLVVVELDGRAFHDTPTQRDRDLDRDLDLLVAGRHTVRLGWGQVYGRPCQTAWRIAALLTRLGWSGQPRPCGPSCAMPLQRRS